MTKEKQIEEMAKDICQIGIYCSKCGFLSLCDKRYYAERAIDKGYRKASDVAREIFEKIEDGVKAAVSALQFENNPIHRKVKHETYSTLMRFVKTIEKKYTEEGK